MIGPDHARARTGAFARGIAATGFLIGVRYEKLLADRPRPGPRQMAIRWNVVPADTHLRRRYHSAVRMIRGGPRRCSRASESSPSPPPSLFSLSFLSVLRAFCNAKLHARRSSVHARLFGSVPARFSYPRVSNCSRLSAGKILRLRNASDLPRPPGVNDGRIEKLDLAIGTRTRVSYVWGILAKIDADSLRSNRWIFPRLLCDASCPSSASS